MRLGARLGTESPVRLVAAGQHELDRLLHVDGLVHAAEERQGGHRTEAEPGVHFAPLVAKEAAIWLLQSHHETHHRLAVDLLERLVGAQNLDGRQGVQQVCIMSLAGGKSSSCGALTPFHKLNDVLAIQPIQLAHYVQGRGAPIDARHAQELGHAVLVVILLLSMVLDVLHMLPELKFLAILGIRITAAVAI